MYVYPIQKYMKMRDKERVETTISDKFEKGAFCITHPVDITADSFRL